MFGLSKIEKIKRNNPIKEFIEAQGISLKKKNGGYIGSCPFHKDDTPSLSITPDKGLFNCFGCGKGGDVITFYQHLKGISNKEAIDQLYALNGHSMQGFKRNYGTLH